MFKSKEEKQRIQEEQRKADEAIQENAKAQREREWAQIEERRKAALILRLDCEIQTHDIICVETDNWKTKQEALNYMLKKSYVCVQNAFNESVYILTFAKKGIEDKFVVK